MNKIVISTTVVRDVRESLIREARAAGITLSEHLRSILEAHVYNQTPTVSPSPDVQSKAQKKQRSKKPKA